MIRKSLIITHICLICLLLTDAQAQTFSPQKAFGQYQQLIWLEQHGLPQNTVQAITRTRNGYLWLGTLAGIARFDGVRFTVFDNGNTPEIKGTYITAFLEDHEGNLWIGTDGGLNLFREGRFRLFSTQDGLPSNLIRALWQDRSGRIWIGSDGGLTRFDGGRFITYTTREGLPNDHVTSLSEDRSDNLWIGTDDGLARFSNNQFTAYSVRNGLPNSTVRSLCWDQSNTLWIGTNGGLSRLKEGRFTTEKMAGKNAIYALRQDRVGSLWVGTLGEGLYLFREGRITHYSSKDGLPGNRVVALEQTPEGDIWIGTDGGLSQLRQGRFEVHTPPNGSAEFVQVVYGDSTGNLWAGFASGLCKFKDGQVTQFTAKNGLPTQQIFSISESRDGGLWLGSVGGGFAKLKNGRAIRWTMEEGLPSNAVSAVLEDRTGNLWIGTMGGGLSLFRDGRFIVHSAKSGELASDFIRTIFEDRNGNLWIGTQSGGISRFKDGKFTTWTTKDGLPSNFILSFYEDRAGSLWIGTNDAGLCRFKDGKFTSIGVKNGLYDSLAFRLLPDTEDDSGNLWMSCNKGIYRVSQRELNEFADGRRSSVTSFAYGVMDGMLSRECDSANPAGWKMPDGTLWFPTTRGVVRVDPKASNQQPPLLAIERVMLNSVELPAGQPVQIHSSQENLEIQYTGLSWMRPQQIHFRYKLLGLDQDWVDAGTRRTAYFPHLPPGTYTFQVIADNGDGVWNLEGKSLRIVVLPPFYQAWWFVALAVLGVAGLAMFTYQYRLRQLRREQIAQQMFAQQLIASQEAERKRIASELHDSLGQHLLIIKNRVALGLRMVAEPNPLKEQLVKEQLNEINESATQAISEARTIAHNLRPINVERLGLTAVLEDMIEKVAAASGLQISTDIESLDGVFTPEDEISLFRIVQESVNNIVKHAQATKAYVEIWREDGQLRATVRDNGRGFGRDFDMAENKRTGLGLTSIAERVRTLGGTHTIQTAPGEGTTLSFSIPL